MYPSATLCRSQQSYHRERARTTLLTNVRIVADRAAKAWGIEADAADDREARHAKTRLTADLIASRKQAAALSRQPGHDEDSDRGIPEYVVLQQGTHE